MPQAGGFIVAKFATGAWMTTAAGAALFKVAAFAVNIALMVGFSYLSMKAFGPKFGNDMQGRKVMTRDGAGYRRLIFGECRVSGNVTYAKTTNSTAGETNGYLHFIVCIAGHEIDSYTEFFLGDEKFTVTNSGNDSNGVPRLVPTGGRFLGKVRIKPYFGTDDQPADADLVAETSGDGNWTANHRGRGVAYLYVRLEWDEEVFPSGWPAMVATVRGWVSDTSSTWTQNCPKLLAEYLQYPKDRGGVGINPADIDADVLANSVAIANESVDTYSGGPTQMRYPINIVVPTSDDYANNIQHFLDCMAGWLDWDQGKWLVRAGAYRASSAVLTEENLVGPVQIIGRESIRNSANGIKGIYVAKDEEYEATDFEPFVARAKNPSGSSTIDTSANTITQEGSGLVDGDRVRFEPFPSGSLPGGLVAGLYYYVINSNSTTFQVSTEEGGSAVNLTSTGSNVFHVFDPFLTEDGERIWADLELPGVSDEYTARRLSKIQLLRMRNDLQIVGDFNFSCFQLAVGDTFRLLNNKAGILGLDGVDVAVTLDGDSDFMFSGSSVFDNHDRVAFIALTDGGEKLVLRQYYWVVNRDGNAFQLSRTRGGEPIEIEDGSGTLQLCEGQMFEVLEVKLNASVGENEGETGFFTVRIHAQETQDDLFDWDSGFVSEATFSPDTELPSVRVVGVPTNLTATSGNSVFKINSDGHVITRVRLNWTAAADAFVRSGGMYEIQFKLTSDSDWIPATVPFTGGDATEVFLDELEDGTSYDFRIRAINSAGNRGAWTPATTHTAVGKTTNTAVVSNLRFESIFIDKSTASLRVKWTNSDQRDVLGAKLWVGSQNQDPDQIIYSSRSSRQEVTIPNYITTNNESINVRMIDTSDNIGPVVSLAVPRQYDGFILPGVWGQNAWPRRDSLGGDETVWGDIVMRGRFSIYSGGHYKHQTFENELDRPHVYATLRPFNDDGPFGDWGLNGIYSGQMITEGPAFLAAPKVLLYRREEGESISGAPQASLSQMDVDVPTDQTAIYVIPDNPSAEIWDKSVVRFSSSGDLPGGMLSSILYMLHHAPLIGVNHYLVTEWDGTSDLQSGLSYINSGTGQVRIDYYPTPSGWSRVPPAGSDRLWVSAPENETGFNDAIPLLFPDT